MLFWFWSKLRFLRTKHCSLQKWSNVTQKHIIIILILLRLGGNQGSFKHWKLWLDYFYPLCAMVRWMRYFLGMQKVCVSAIWMRWSQRKFILKLQKKNSHLTQNKVCLSHCDYFFDPHPPMHQFSLSWGILQKKTILINCNVSVDWPSGH